MVATFVTTYNRCTLTWNLKRKIEKEKEKGKKKKKERKYKRTNRQEEGTNN